MLGTKQYDLTWEHFEQLHADKRSVFENLCRSLFQRELCADGVILHSDPNHPGIEVAPVLSKDGKARISFQAKYFENGVGYNQIKESAKISIEHYKGVLNTIYLYSNKDITETSDSYNDIKTMLNDAGIDVILVTGQAILDCAAEYPTVLSCYFGLDFLDDAWFQRNLQISLDSLGKRYNSLFNVDTKAQRDLSIFLREDAGIGAINGKKKDLLSAIKDIRWRCDGEYKKIINTLTNMVKDIPDITASTIYDSLRWKEDFGECGQTIFKDLQIERDKIYAKIESCQKKDSDYEKLRNKAYLVDHLIALPDYLGFQKKELEYITNRVILVTGEMGTGKSQLLANSAKRVLENARPALLLLGQTYISDENIEIQIMNGLEGLNAGQSFESLLAVLDEKAYLAGGDAVIFIDAINESRNREIWKNGINRLIVEIEKYKNIRLVISLREGFEELTLSEKVLSDQKDGLIAEVVHYGLNDDSPVGIYEFLSNCGIPFSPEYYLQAEMTNPLFLTWFCQTYTGEEQGLTELIEKIIEQADREGSKEAGFSEAVGVLRELLYNLIDIEGEKTITKSVLLNLPAWTVYGVTKKTAYIKAIERAGVLVSYVRNQEEIFYIGYNMLEEYLKAGRIIDREQDKERIREYCTKQLLGIDEEGNVTNYGNESIFAMLSSLYAMKYGKECIDIVDCITDEWNKEQLVCQYIRTFAWRSSYIKFDDFLELINKYNVYPKQVWNVFIENATKENSELNAIGLSKLLNRYKLNRRDYLWTMEINGLTEEDRIVSLAYFIEKGNKFEGLSENKVFLLLILFSWMLSSSNRTLRDRISKTMVEIMKSHFGLCKKLLENFKLVNDPYIIQRMYGIVFGAVMKRNVEFRKEFAELVGWIYDEIFDQEYVYPDILLRDYARLIMERFLWEYPEDAKMFDVSKIRPPYRSVFIPKVEETDYGDKKFDQPGVRDLLFSMKFDFPVKGLGFYGDFGRYTFQAAVGHFNDVDVANVYYYALRFIFEDLGYRSEYFGEYDLHRAGFDRHHVKKVERIGKKYQWIAMYNILARLSDVYRVRGWDWNDKKGYAYEGPWEPYVRDFDPTLNIRIKPIKNMIKIELPKYGDESFLDFDVSNLEVENWIISDDKMFQDFPNRLIHKDESGVEWVSLHFYQENKMQPPNEEVSVMGFPIGEQHIWSIASMHIVIDKREKLMEEDLISSGFIQSQSSNTRDCYSLFSREYSWSPGYKAEFEMPEEEDDIVSIKAIPASINILWEEEYDASQEETTSFMIPEGSIIRVMNLYEKSVDGIYYCNEEIAALDLLVMGNEHSELIIRRDILNQYMEKTNVKLFWDVVGEKQYFLGGHNQKWQRREGYFVYESNEIKGHIHIVDNI
ncbi:MAG: ATP-binding protein [Lachnospiraceae bacterium]|nr:hypothetical protein [uncultured Schaedlerella sp.]MCI8671978.1 ATP-binding protein [Lachnospiraceae bacterium]